MKIKYNFLFVFWVTLITYSLLSGFDLINVKFYPLSNWKLFAINPSTVVDFDIVEKETRKSLFENKNLFPRNNDPFRLYDSIQVYAQNEMTGEYKENFVVIKQYMEKFPKNKEYVLIQRKYNPINFYKNREIINSKTIRTINLYEHL